MSMPECVRLRGWPLRLCRLGLLACAVLLLRDLRPVQPLTLAQVQDRFPKAVSLEATSDLQAVRDGAGAVLGFVTQTSPDADDVIGYSGPTNMLIVMDAQKQVTALQVLRSADTPDHVAEVIAKRDFFKAFTGLKLGALEPKQIDAVSGATLTSSAITEGVLRKLGRQGPSLRFPEPITLAEVQLSEPTATKLHEVQRGVLDVLDAKGKIIAKALRTAPASDAQIGYKGPSDWLVLLDPTTMKVKHLQLRKSYDTKRYVAYVTDDRYYLSRFHGLSMEELATLDFAKAKLEGVSGATDTSYALAEGLKLRGQQWSSDRAWLPVMRWRWQDWGHVLVLISALLMAFTSLRGVSWLRVLHHIGLVFYVGFIGGEMLSQALFMGWAQHALPWRSAPGLVLVGMIALLAPVLSRRQLYCHHVCPHGALQQLVMKRVPWQVNLPKWMEKLPMVMLAVIVMLVAMRVAVNLNLIEPFDAYVWRVASGVSIGIAVLGLVASVFVPMAYCRAGCPTGALFKLLRYAGGQDVLGRREVWSVAVLIVIGAWRWGYG